MNMNIYEYKIPKDIMLSKILGRKEKLLFSVLLTHSFPHKGKCKITNKTLADIIGIKNPNQITKSLQKLKKNNLISIEYQNKTKPESNDNVPKSKFQYKTERIIVVNGDYLKRRRKKHV